MGNCFSHPFHHLLSKLKSGERKQKLKEYLLEDSIQDCIICGNSFFTSKHVRFSPSFVLNGEEYCSHPCYSRALIREPLHLNK